jgi:hypothetical protein
MISSPPASEAPLDPSATLLFAILTRTKSIFAVSNLHKAQDILKAEDQAGQQNF